MFYYSMTENMYFRGNLLPWWLTYMF